MAVKIGSSLICAVFLISGTLASGQEREHEHGDCASAGRRRVHRNISRASRIQDHAAISGSRHLRGWDKRPPTVDREAYKHNFQAAHTYHIGAYRRPSGWAPHHWGYGQILPRIYWAPQYFISDYWLFSLEVPPPGYEWVRDDTDAALIDTNSGEILQVEYGVFA